jgi:hypothetical protein
VIATGTVTGESGEQLRLRAAVLGTIAPAADRIELSAEQVERLNNLAPASGERHEKGNMAVIDRDGNRLRATGLVPLFV